MVKKGSEGTQGLPKELSGVVSHEARRLADFVMGSKSFISDDRLERELVAHLHTAPASTNRVLQDYAGIALGNCVQVLALRGAARARGGGLASCVPDACWREMLLPCLRIALPDDSRCHHIKFTEAFSNNRKILAWMFQRTNKISATLTIITWQRHKPSSSRWGEM